MAQHSGQLIVHVRHIDAPDDAVPVIGGKVLRGEVRRHQGGIGPVQQAGGQAKLLII